MGTFVAWESKKAEDSTDSAVPLMAQKQLS